MLGKESLPKQSKKNKDPLEGIFGKSKRLPVFSVITFTTKDGSKKQSKNKKAKKVHKFNKQHSEKISAESVKLDTLILPCTTQLSSKRSARKKIVLTCDDSTKTNSATKTSTTTTSAEQQ